MLVDGPKIELINSKKFNQYNLCVYQGFSHQLIISIFFL
jgi:hypothetical protein